MPAEDDEHHDANVSLMERNHDIPAGSTKEKVGRALESQYAEFFIMFLILCDVILVSIEAGIDHQYVCIDGQVVQESPDSIAGGSVHSFGYLESSAMDQLMDRVPNPMSYLQGPTARNGMRHRKAPLYLPGPSFLQEEPVTAKNADSKGGEPIPGETSKKEHNEGAEEHAAGKEEHGAGHGHGHEEHGHGEEHGHASHDAHGHGHGHEEVNLALVCDHPEGHHAHHISHTCHMLSIGILCIFLVELLLKYWIHPKHFCSSKFELLDLFVVVSSLIVDIYISWLISEHKAGAKDAQYILILLIVLRLWRVVRIVHGVYQIKTMEDERGQSQVEEKEKEIERLKAVLRRNNIEETA